MFPVLSCFPLDLMHLCGLNLPQHLLEIWRNAPRKNQNKILFDGPNRPQFIVLDNNTKWRDHGKLVKSVKPYLLTCFGRVPWNPVEKINSGYQACEYLLYFWALGPALFRLILPHDLWVHFCKLVCVIWIVQQRCITRQQIFHVHALLLEWEHDFELKYYD
jgi:hypothetical protein